MVEKVHQIWVDGRQVGVVDLEAVLAEVHALGIHDNEVLADEIMVRVRRSNYIPAAVETAYRRALWAEYRRFLGEDVEPERTVTEIRILGPGCPRCEELMRRVRIVLTELDLPADVQHIRDLNRISGYGVIHTPGLVVNGRVVMVGRVPANEELKTLLSRSLEPGK